MGAKRTTLLLALVAATLLVAAAQCQPDNVKPTATVAAPAPDGWLRGVDTVSAAASDNVGVTRVEFHLSGNGVTNRLVATGTPDPHFGWYAHWDTRPFANGKYQLAAKAFDGAGNSSTSTPVTFHIGNPHFTVTPSTGLRDGQNVVISGTGLHNHYQADFVYVIECGDRPPSSRCDTHTLLAEQPADDNGNITLNYRVRRVLDLGTLGTFDCAAADTCSIAFDPPAWAPISFAK